MTKHIKRVHGDTDVDENSFGANISVKQSDLKLNGEIQGQNETYLCEPCNMMFTSEGKFMEHAMTVHNEQPENIEIQQAKGQLISKCALGVSKSSKKLTKVFP